MEADSWNGSNALHLTGEDYSSERTTRMLANGSTDDLTVIDLERKGPRGYTARRQVVHVWHSLWLVIDHTLGDAERGTT